MSIYSRDKCTDEQLKEWKKEILKYLVDNGIDYTKLKMRFQKNYDGNCKIYTYQTELSNNKKSRRYLTVEKDDVSEDGWYSGKFEQKLWMGVYFYRSEWKEYFEEDQKDQRKWDLADIKKRIELKKIHN